MTISYHPARSERFIMAKRRMFSSDIVDTDKYLDMPVSARCLYYDLGMRADDDGFVSPRKVMRLTGATEDDLKVLISKQFIIPFESGVIVIKDWKINNYIQKDRYNDTIYKEERKQLCQDDNGSYILDTTDIQNVYTMDTQVRLGKVRLGKVRKEIDTKKKLEKDWDRESLKDGRIKTELIKSYKEQFVSEELEKMCNWLDMTGKKYKNYLAFAKNWCARSYEDWQVKRNRDFSRSNEGEWKKKKQETRILYQEI